MVETFEYGSMSLHLMWNWNDDFSAIENWRENFINILKQKKLNLNFALTKKQKQLTAITAITILLSILIWFFSLVSCHVKLYLMHSASSTKLYIWSKIILNNVITDKNIFLINLFSKKFYLKKKISIIVDKQYMTEFGMLLFVNK